MNSIFSEAATAADLFSEHQPHVIGARLDDLTTGHGTFGDAVLGAVDGAVTTFAVIAGAMGGDFSRPVMVVLAAASLLADGASMAASNYLSIKSRADLVARARRIEELHIETIPEGEKEEVRQIFYRKGLRGQALEHVVETIASDKNTWVNTMLTDELGLQLHTVNPHKAAAVTFGAFVVVGSVPLIPFFNPLWSTDLAFYCATSLTAGVFVGIGALRGIAAQRHKLRSAVETLATGIGAASIAYAVGWGLRNIIGY